MGAWREELVGRREVRLSGVITVELVAGRVFGVEVPFGLVLRSASSATFLFFDVGREGVVRSGLPNAKPTAATPTVLDATSCRR